MSRVEPDVGAIELPARDAALLGPSDDESVVGRLGWAIGGFAIVIALGVLVGVLSEGVPTWTKGTGFGKVAGSIEFPVYAIIVGLAGNGLLSALHVRERPSGGFRTEFLIKTGLVLLGASINFSVIVRAAGPAVAQAVLLISSVFFATW
ncbi:hypothetical protein [Propionibacterium freudenreichii]|nr:hypothetical protein [Propionibacterium freudenreichii]